MGTVWQMVFGKETSHGYFFFAQLVVLVHHVLLVLI
jgi:hypothetical protein